MRKILMFTTTILSATSQQNLDRLFSSIKLDNYQLTMFLLIQNSQEEIKLNAPDFVSLHKIEGIVSLSKARNLLINEARKTEIFSDYDLVLFPDDDCWYPLRNLQLIADEFSNKNLDLLVSKYRSNRHDSFIKDNLRKARVNWLCSNASSITIFVSGSIFNKNAYFNEMLGVGAPYNGGEDLDYALRCFKSSEKPIMYNGFLMGHKDKNSENKYKYFEGSLAVLNMHKLNGPIHFALYIRKIFVGLFYVLKLEISISYFLRALTIKL